MCSPNFGLQSLCIFLSQRKPFDSARNLPSHLKLCRDEYVAGRDFLNLEGRWKEKLRLWFLRIDVGIRNLRN